MPAVLVLQVILEIQVLLVMLVIPETPGAQEIRVTQDLTEIIIM